MHATSADANSVASSWSDSPLVMWTMSEIPSSAMSLWVGAVRFDPGDQLKLEITFDAQPGHRVQQRADTLERGIRAGDRDDTAGPARP